MSIESEAYQAVFGFAEGWAAKNQQVLPAEIKKQYIGKTQSLQKSFRFASRKSGDTLLIQQFFNTSGRFVDMGVGKGHSLENKAGKALAMDEMAGKKKKGRKAKKWFRVFYARLSDLEGALGIRIMEQAVKAVKPVKPVN